MIDFKSLKMKIVLVAGALITFLTILVNVLS